jgi:hypothetical protein
LKLEKNIIKEALRIKSIYETPNVEVDKIIAELKEDLNNKIMETTEIKTQINIPEGKKLVGTKVENGVIIPIFEDKDVELSNTWEEWCRKNKRDEFVYINGYSEIKESEPGEFPVSVSTIQDKNFIKGESRAKAFLALMQLMNLRDEYRQGWEPNYGDHSDKYVIICHKTAITCGTFRQYNAILSFQSADIRGKFLKNFRELIEQAKEFI